MIRLLSIPATILTVLTLCLFITESSEAQLVRSNNSARVSPNAAVIQTIGTTTVEVRYGRPSVNGRDVFGGLQPYDAVWRAGANEATALLLSDDVLIEGELVEAGNYTIYMIPSEGDWTVIINSIQSWGLSYDESGDVVRVEVSAEEADHMEQLEYSFEDVTAESAELVLHWAETRVPVTISTP